MSDVDLAWASGFLDGEGYFGINVHSNRWLVPEISAAQAYRPKCLEKLRDVLGGRVREESGRNHVYHWSVSGGKAIRLCLPKIIPYMTVKREEAEIVLEFSERMLSHRTGGRQSLTDEEWAERYSYREKLLLLRPRSSESRIVTRVLEPPKLRPRKSRAGIQLPKIQGSRHRNSKLSDDQVVEIRKTYTSGGTSYHKIAEEYGVSDQLIYLIIKRKRWTHIGLEEDQ